MRKAHQGAHLLSAPQRAAVRASPIIAQHQNPDRASPSGFASLAGPADGRCPDDPGTVYPCWCWKVLVPGVPWQSHPQCWRRLASLLLGCRQARGRCGDARPVFQFKNMRSQPDNGSVDCLPCPVTAGRNRRKSGGQAAHCPQIAAFLRSTLGKPPYRISLIPLSALGC